MSKRPTRCRYCSRQADVDVRISKRGICQDCALVRIEANAEAQLSQSGPLYDKWKVNRDAGRKEWLNFVETLHTPGGINGS